MLITNRIRADQIISLIALGLVILLYRSLENLDQTVPALADWQFQREKLVYSTQMMPIPLWRTPQATDSANSLIQADITVETPESPEAMLASLTATSAAIIDLDSSAILLAKNGTEKLLPASTTKLMTAIIARELFQLDEVVTVTEPPMVNGAAVIFHQGEQLTMDSLIQALLIQSGNDAALIIAKHHPAGETGFVRDMNLKAQTLNLTNTHFQNAIGFDHPEHYSTAIDLALLSREAMKDEVIRAIVRQPRTLITDITGTRQHFLYSTHLLLSQDPTVVGIKTGTTEGAGEVLITQVEREGRRILVVVMGSSDRYLDTKKLIEWTYSHYQWLKFEDFN